MEGAQDLVDKTVLVKLEDNEGLQFAGVPEEGPFFCKITAVDQIGVWVENKKFVTVEIRDSKGRFIPEEKQESVNHIVNLLLPWRKIQTVVLFAERDAAEIAPGVLGAKAKGAGTIGFLS
ncbi:MAG: hypothetical protein JSV33_12300 [bacterium]|nr:MAG: hypothetical protein JSV33_12300 [bacterium]